MDDGFGAIFWLCILGAIVWFAWLDDSKLRYEIQYDDAEVTAVEKPRDCDFLTAPLGRKNCSYKKEVSIARFSVSVKGEPIVSYNEGETWHPNPFGPKSGARVEIYWVRTKE